MELISVYPPEVISLRFRFLDLRRRPVIPSRVAAALQKENQHHLFEYGADDNLAYEGGGIFVLSLQFLPQDEGQWVWHIEGGVPSENLKPNGFMKSGTGVIQVRKPKVVISV